MVRAHELGRRGRVSAFVARILSRVRAAWMRTTLALPLALVLAHLPAGSAAESDIASLNREIAVLKETVQKLQARLDQLEFCPGLAEQPASAVARAGRSTIAATCARSDADAPVVAAVPAASMAARQLGDDPIARSPRARLRASWSKIDSGSTTLDVSTLLGEPTSRLKLDGRDVWYYSYPELGKGSVFFTDDGHVSGYHSPFAWGG